MTISEHTITLPREIGDSQTAAPSLYSGDKTGLVPTSLVSRPISDQSIGMKRPEALAESLYIAASILSIGPERAFDRVVHDVSLLTRRTMQLLSEMGYEEEIITDERSLAVMAGRIARGDNEPRPVMYVRQIEGEQGKETARIALLPGGKSLWGVAIIPMTMNSRADLEEATAVAAYKVLASIEMVASQLEISNARLAPHSMEAAIIRSTRTYDLALGVAQFDPEFVRSMNEMLLGSDKERLGVSMQDIAA